MPRAKEILPNAILGTQRDLANLGTDGATSRGPYHCRESTSAEISLLLFSN